MTKEPTPELKAVLDLNWSCIQVATSTSNVFQAIGTPDGDGGINGPSKNYDGCDDAAHMLERIMFRRNYPAVTLEAVAARLEQIVAREAQKLAHEHVKRLLKAKK